MLVIYQKNEAIFDTLGLGVLRDFKSEPLITEVLNGLFNLEFDYAIEGWLSETLTEENIIKANGQLFRIWNVKKSIDETKITILAKHIFFDLEKSNFLENVAPTNKTADNALIWMLDHAATPTNFIVNGDCTKIASARYVRINPIEAIYNADNCLLTRFGGEIELDNYNITLHNKRGKDLGLEIRQNKNLNGAEYQLDFSNVATRIMPIGKDGIMLPEKYVDSPLINNYFSPLYLKYDVDIGPDEANGVSLSDCYQQMREFVQNLYNSGIDKPLISVSIDFIELSKTTEYKKYSNLETAHLGDSCRIFIPTLNLNLTARIVKTVYNCSKNRITLIELGTPMPNYVTSTADVEKTIKNALSTDSPTGLLQQAKNSATEMIKHPFTGYIYISEETGEFYLMDNKDINLAQSVWKFGLGGIGYSPTGINGEYETAITQDGQIVADFITTGIMSAARVEGLNQLILTVKNNNDSLNTLVNNVENFSFIEITNAYQSDPIRFSFYGDLHYTYLNENTYLDEKFFLKDSYLTIESETGIEKVKLPYFELNYTEELYDEFVVENNKAYIIRRLDSNKQKLDSEVIEYLEDIIIPLKNNYNKLRMEDFELNYLLSYNVQNNYTKTMATKTELKILENEITAEVNTKADDKEIKGLLELQADNFNVELSNKADDEEIKGLLELQADEFGVQLEKKVNNANYTHAEIVAKINDDSSQVKIKSDKVDVDSIAEFTNSKLAKSGSTIVNGDNIRTGVIQSENYEENITGTKINLNDGSIDTKNFKSDGNGNIKVIGEINATTGEIGGYKIEENSLYSENYSKYDYTDSDLSKLQKYLSKQITLTDAEKKRLDANGDNNLDIYDLLIMQKSIMYGITTTKPSIIKLFSGSRGIDTGYSITDGNDLERIKIGLEGFSTSDGNTSTHIYPFEIQTPVVTQTSKESIKKNITKFEHALSIIKKSEIYSYNLKNETDGVKKHVGFVIPDLGGNYVTPNEVLSLNKDGIEVYTVASICWKAIQEQQFIIEKLEKEIEVLKGAKKAI